MQNDIYNNNPENIISQDIYDSFNNFIFSKDLKVIGKLLKRFEFFNKIKDLPGDIVELGVFKGSGMATWCKFLEIYAPHANKKVVGFDLFADNVELFNSYKQGHQLFKVVNRVDKNDLMLNSIYDNLKWTNKFICVKGDIKESTINFCLENPGFRISLLYIDVDLDEPTYYALTNLWDRIIPGGYIIFDEYDYHKFDESNGVDRFLKERNIEYSIKNTNFMAPTSFMIKK